MVSDALYPWHKGGKEIRYFQLLQELPQRGMDVSVYSMKWWESDPEVEYFELGSLAYIAICPQISMYKDHKRSVTQALLFALSTFRLLNRKFDVIEADHMPYLQLLPLRVIAWIKRVPLVVTWHEVWGGDTWRSYMGPLSLVAATIEKVSVRLPNMIVAVSEGTAESSLQWVRVTTAFRLFPTQSTWINCSRVRPTPPLLNSYLSVVSSNTKTPTLRLKRRQYSSSAGTTSAWASSASGRRNCA